ncbi:MAG: hypothetical protein ACI4AW_05060 [Paludibacteraceae bacterium]
MKKILTALMLCLVSIIGYGETLTFHTHDAFSPYPYLDGAISYLGWESKAPLGIAEIFMIDETTARVVLNQAKDATTYYFKVGDKIYYYYYNGKCYHYAIYKDTKTHYQIKTYRITSLKNNEIQMELEE